MKKTIGLLLVIIFFWTCQNEKNETIKVGVVLPLTGPIAIGGTRVLDGVILAVDEYNLIQKVQVDLKIEDSQGKPSIGVNAINRLIIIEKVEVIIGDLTSGVTLAMAPIAEKNKKVLLAPGASNPKLREAGDFIFRNWVSDDFDGEVAANYLINNLDIKSVIVLYIQNDYGEGLKNSFISEFVKMGGEVRGIEAFSEGQQDFRNILTKVKNKNFGGIYIAGQPKEMGYIIKQMKELDFESVIFSNASVEEKDFQTIAGNISINLYYTSPTFNLNDTASIVKIFVKSYREKFDETPDIASAHGYDAARLVLQCIGNNNITGAEIRDCLYNIKNFEGVTGISSFDSNGDIIKGVLVKKITQQGNIQFLEYYNPDTLLIK